MSTITTSVEEHIYMTYLYNLIIKITDMARNGYIPKRIIKLENHQYKLTDDSIINLRKAIKLLAKGGNFVIYLDPTQTFKLVVRYQNQDNIFYIKYEKYR